MNTAMEQEQQSGSPFVLRRSNLVQLNLRQASPKETEARHAKSVIAVDDLLIAINNGRLAFYDSSGKQIDFGTDSLEFGYTLASILESTSYRHSKELVTEMYDKNTFTQVLARIEIGQGDTSSTDRKELTVGAFTPNRQAIKSDFTANGDLDVDKSVLPLVNLENTNLHFDSESGILLFVGPNSILSFRTRDADGSALPPQQWRKLSSVERDAISAEDLRKSPALSAYVHQFAGVSIPGTELRLDRPVEKIAINDPNGMRCVYSAPCSALCADPANPSTIHYFDPFSKKLIELDVSTLKPRESDIDAPGEVSNLLIEPGGRYMLLTTVESETEGEERETLHVIDRVNKQVVSTLENVSGPLSIAENGNIFFADQSGLRVIETNFSFLAAGGREELTQARSEQLEILADAIEDIELPQLPDETSANEGGNNVQTEEDLFLNRMAETMERRFGPKVEATETLEQLRRLEEQIEQLKSRDDLRPFPEIFQRLERAIAEQRDSLKIEAFSTTLDHISVNGESDSNYHLARRSYNELLAERAKLAIRDHEQRLSIDDRIGRLGVLMQSLAETHREETETRISAGFEIVSRKIDSVGSFSEFDLLVEDPDVRSLYQEIDLLPDPGRILEHRERIAQLKQSKLTELQTEDSEKQDKEMRELAMREAKYDSQVADVIDALDRVRTQKQLESFEKENPVLRAYRLEVAKLEPVDRGRRERELKGLLADALRRVTSTSARKVGKKDGIVQFGKVEFPVFPGYSGMAHPRIVPDYDGAPTGKLIFQGVAGMKFEPGVEGLELDLEDPKVKGAIREHRERALRFFNQRERRVPAQADFWRVNPHVEASLERMARKFSTMQQLKKGVLIQVGDAGVGKNILFEMFAHMTNRELFIFSCNRQTEKEDVTFAYMYDPNRGTYRASSEFLKALQTPGAIILMDELNTLPVGVSKMFNPLFAHDRTIYDPFGNTIKAEPSVLFAGSMNPQNYLGTTPLAQEMVSRGNFMEVDYPAEKIGSKWSPYEAEMMAQYLHSLAHLSQDEFYAAWDYTINGDKTREVSTILTNEVEAALRDIHCIVQTGNRIREAYRAFQTGKDSSSQIGFIFSLRESEWIAAEMNYGLDVRTAIKEVVLPKAASPIERSNLEAIIDNV